MAATAINNLLKEISADDCRWITINNNRICIKSEEGNLQPEHKISADTKKILDSIPNVAPFSSKALEDEEKIRSALKKADPLLYSAIYEYTGALSKSIERQAVYLHTGNLEGAEHYSEHQREWADALDAAMQATAERNVTVYRGMYWHPNVSQAARDELTEVKAGDELSIAGMKSFSHSEDAAFSFSGRSAEPDAHRYMIEISGATKGLNLSTVSQHTVEAEFLTSGRFVVDSVKRNEPPEFGGLGKITYIKMHQVGLFSRRGKMRTEEQKVKLVHARRKEKFIDHWLGDHRLGGLIQGRVRVHESRGYTGSDIQNLWVWLQLLEADEEGRWVTISGNHVFIRNGTIERGPKHLIGKKLAHVLIGAGIYHTANAPTAEEVKPLFNDPKVRAYEKEIANSANDFGVSILSKDRAAGVWLSNREPSFDIEAHAQSLEAADAWAAHIVSKAPETQDAVIRFEYNEQGSGAMYVIRHTGDEEHAIGKVLEHGFEGMTAPLGKGELVIYDEDGSKQKSAESAAKEFHGHLTVSRGNVRLIRKDEYERIEKAYRKKTRRTEEARSRSHYYNSHLQTAEEILEASDECTWITKNGVHICIGAKGDIEKGPQKLVGKNVKKDIAPTYDTSKAPTKPLGEHETTKEAYFDESTGQWEPGRAAYHQYVVEKTIGKVTAPEGQKEAVILGGGTASGKTTFKREYMAADPNRVDIDPDTMKLAIPEFEKLKETDPNHAAARVHEESSAVTKMVLAETMAKGLNFIYDSTTSGNGGKAFLRLLMERGYKIHVVFADVPISQAIIRARERALKSPDPVNRGRNVPLDIIYSAHSGAAKNFMAVKDLKGISSVRLYDNTRDKDPRIVYEREGNKVSIKNREFWNRYKRKAQGISEQALRIFLESEEIDI